MQAGPKLHRWPTAGRGAQLRGRRSGGRRVLCPFGLTPVHTFQMQESASRANGPFLGEVGEPDLSLRAAPRDASMALALTFVGAVVGNAIISSVSDRGNSLSDVPEFSVWARMIAAQTALWALLLPISLLTLWGIWTRYDVPRLKLSALHLALGTIVAGSLAVNASSWRPSVLNPYASRIQLLTIVGFFVAGPPIIGMWSVAAALQRVCLAVGQTADTWSRVDARVVEHLMYLRSTLRRLLAILAAIVAALTLSAGAQRNAVIAWGERFGVAVEFPAILVVLYGLLFTSVVALIYVPVYVRLESVGHAFVGKRFRVPSVEPAADWYSGRANLMALLQLGVRPAEAFQSSFAILAPLTAGLLSVILPS